MGYLKASDYKIGDKIIFTLKGKEVSGVIAESFGEDGIFVFLNKTIYVEKQEFAHNPQGYNTDIAIRIFKLNNDEGEEFSLKYLRKK